MLTSKSLKIVHNTFTLKGNAPVLSAGDLALHNAVEDAKKYKQLKFYAAIAFIMLL